MTEQMESVNLKVFREDDDWYAQPKNVTVKFEKVVEFTQLANALPMLEPIARMIPEELLKDTVPVSEVLKKLNAPKQNLLSNANSECNQLFPHDQPPPECFNDGTPCKLFWQFQQNGQERNIGYYLKSQFVQNVTINYDANGPKENM